MTTASASAEATAEAPKVPSTPLDEFGQAAKERARGLIETLNSRVKVLKASQGDRLAMLEALRENPPTDEAKKYHDAIADLSEKIAALKDKFDGILEPLVDKQIEDAKAGSEGVQAEVDDLKKKVSAATKYIKELYGPEHLEDLPNVEGVRAVSAGGNAGGGGGKRVRGFDFYVDGELITTRNGQGVQVSNLAAAAKHLDLSAESLRESFYSAAGTTDNKKAPSTVEFTVVAGEGDARKTFTVTAKRVAEGDTRATETETASDAAEAASE